MMDNEDAILRDFIDSKAIVPEAINRLIAMGYASEDAEDIVFEWCFDHPLTNLQ